MRPMIGISLVDLPPPPPGIGLFYLPPATPGIGLLEVLLWARLLLVR
jgi:hypothetical protein